MSKICLSPPGKLETLLESWNFAWKFYAMANTYKTNFTIFEISSRIFLKNCKIQNFRMLTIIYIRNALQNENEISVPASLIFITSTMIEFRTNYVSLHSTQTMNAKPVLHLNHLRSYDDCSSINYVVDINEHRFVSPNNPATLFCSELVVLIWIFTQNNTPGKTRMGKIFITFVVHIQNIIGRKAPFLW
jgi:hypothetical protein